MKKGLILLMLLIPLMINSSAYKPKIIVDSEMTFEQAIEGTKAPKELIDSLCLIDVHYFSTDGQIHKGQLVIHKDVKEEVEKIFKLALQYEFPIKKAIPIVKYGWSDSISMAENNTSAFNYRNIAGTNRLSRHSYGKAVDINPMFNPYIDNGVITPKGGKWDKTRKGTLTEDCPIVKRFIELGWTWGGNFQSYKDYHHFDKR